MNWKLLALLLIVAVVSAGIYFYTNPDTTKVTQSDASQSPTASASASVAPSSSVTPMQTPANLPATVHATIVTAKGNIELDLYSKVAPVTVGSFVHLAQSGFYNGIKFHRVVPDFVIQAGDPLSKTDDPNTGTGGPGYTFKDEINPKALGISDQEIAQLQQEGYQFDFTLKSLPVVVGSLAMANAGPNTNGSQFFIVTTKDQPALNGKYTVFGKVTKGMDIARKITQGDVIKEIKIAL